MAKNKKHHEEEEGGEAWLLPYSDLMTLLLAVFIVLFAVSQMDSAKAEEMATAFGGIFNGGTGILNSDGTSVIPLYADTMPEVKENVISVEKESVGEEQGNGTLFEQQELNELEQIKGELQEYFSEVGLENEVTLRIDERGLVISLSSTILFDSGSAEIKPKNKDELITIAKTINKIDHYIRIEGHTDNIPINTTAYPSNWELSAARAAQVVKLFVDKGDINPEKMVVIGYGEFKPIGDNNTVEGRARNRRIDIIMLNNKYNSLEDQIEDVNTVG